MSEEGEAQWSGLFHAFGPAVDTYAHLEALRRGDDFEPRDPGRPWIAQYAYVWSFLYCHGHLTPALVPALRYLERTVGDSDFGGSDPGLRVGERASDEPERR